MKWIMLLIAGVTEVTWAVAMKAADGFTKTVPSVITVVGYILSAVFLSMALKELPLGTAYAMWTGFGIVGTAVLGVLLFAMWTGFGIVGTAVLGVLLFHETMSITQVICVLLIVTGIVGLKLTSA